MGCYRQLALVMSIALSLCLIGLANVGSCDQDPESNIHFSAQSMPYSNTSVEISDPIDNAIIDSTAITIFWNATDRGAGIHHYLVQLDDEAPTEPLNPKNHTFMGLSQWMHTVTIIVYDASQNFNLTSVTFYVDTIPPELAITYPEDLDYLSTSNVTVEWIGTDQGSGVVRYEWRLDAGTWQFAAGNTEWSFPDLSEGMHSVDIRATDLSNKATERRVVFYIDHTLPTLSMTAPSEGAVFDEGNVTINWEGSDVWSGLDHFEIWLNGQFQFTSDGTSPNLSNLRDGVYNVTLKAIDKAGNAVSDHVTFIVDTISPTIEITSPTHLAYTNSTPLISWTYDELNLDHFEIKIDGGTFAPISSVTSYQVSDLTDGPHSVTVRIVDKAGWNNASVVQFNVDTEAPTIVSFTPSGTEVVVDAPIWVEFSGQIDPDSINAQISGISDVTVRVQNSKVILQVDSDLTFGTDYDVSISARDMAGNKETFSWSFTTTDLGLINGRVLDSNGLPVAGANVSLDSGESVLTNETGHFSIYVPAGSYNITIQKEGMPTMKKQVTVAAGSAAAMGDVEFPPTDGLTLGWVVAVIALVVVGGMIYLSHIRKKDVTPRTVKKAFNYRNMPRKPRKPPEDEF